MSVIFLFRKHVLNSNYMISTMLITKNAGTIRRDETYWIIYKERVMSMNYVLNFCMIYDVIIRLIIVIYTI